MNKNKKLLALLLAATATFALAGCNFLPSNSSSNEPDTSTESSIPVAPLNELTISSSSLTLALGASETLTVGLVQDGVEVEEFEVEWSSSNEAVATVVNGVVTAVSKGNATITAKVGDLVATCMVVVAEPVTLTISETVLDLFEEETATLTVTASDENEYDYVWSSSDESVATVVDGVVTAVGAGTATVTVTNGTASVTCEVNVYEKIVTMYLSQSSANMKVGEDLTINAYFSDGSSPVINWETSDGAVATVVGGVVTAVGSGTATITATSGDLTASCVVTITDSFEVILSEITSEETLYVGDSVTLMISAKKK